MIIKYLYFTILMAFLQGTTASDLVAMACSRNPSLPYCKSEIRRAVPKAPEDPFKEKFEPEQPDITPKSLKSLEEEKEEDISLENEEETTTSRPRRPTTFAPVGQNILYTIFPTLQKEKDYRKYCPANQYTFQTTCLPGKKLRYDLQIFCQEFADTCGVPNLNLYRSRYGREDDGRPKGYGQKQQNGNLGLGKSFGFGMGAIPGFEFVSSQGADIGNGNLPFFNQIGGMMFNSGSQVGVLGHKTGMGPARSLNSLTHGYPSLGLNGQEPNNGDKKLSQEVLKSFGVPNLPGLNNVFKKLGGNKKKQIKGFEPGYGAVNPNAPFAIGKTDLDALNLPGGFGDVEIEKGAGMGIGK